MPSSLSNPIQLVGSQQVINCANGAEPLLRFYGDLYARLTKEVRYISNLTRYIGFQRHLDGNDFQHFFGIEVGKIEGIPPGMMAWELCDRQWTVWEPRNGCDVIASQDEIDWQWLSPSPSTNRWYTGEFTCRKTIAADHPYWISANAYVGRQETEVSQDEVILVEYDPSWQQQYNEMAQWLCVTLGNDIVLRTEHYGSTAIPGIPAKPIIDVLVEVPSFSEAKRRVVPLLNSPKWEYWWSSDHMLFIKRNKLMGQRTHHIHLATAGHALWKGVVFRDYLCDHPQEARRYAALKRELAEKYREDREHYTDAKTSFVQAILSKALKES